METNRSIAKDGRNLIITDEKGGITRKEFDELDNLTTIIYPDGSVKTYEYEHTFNRRIKETDARGKVWTYEYDAAGHLIKVTDPLNNITQMFYDAVGNKIKEIDAEGKQKLFEYDVRNNLIKITDASGNETLFEYNTDGKLVKQTDPEGKVINYQYDNEGHLIKTIDGNGNEIAMEYSDTSGSGCSSCSGGNTNQPSKVTYPTFEKTFAYDTRGRKISETDILSDTESYVTNFTYDVAGNLVSKTDKESKTTLYAYDSLNRLSDVTDPASGVTEYAYDNRDNLIALLDAKGQTTQFEYDKNNHLVKETRPVGEATSYTYDTAGNLVSKTDAKNQKTEYVYDDAGRLTSIMYFNPSDHVNPVKTVTFTYDKVGNLTGYNDGATSATYTYDDNYRKVSETVNYGTFSLTNTYTYNKNNTKKTFTGPDNITYGYLYDANNKLTGVQIPNVGFITISEYTWNRPKTMTLPGGSTRQFTYDPLMRTKQITTKDPGQNTLMNYQYTFDKMDNIQLKTTEHGNYQYQYDDLYRLTTADNLVQDDEAFTYDPVGNRMTSADTTGNWSYNTNNELTGYDDASYVYDDNGNMTQKTVAGVVTRFFYNTEDRMERVEDGSGNVIATYYYDPFGRRLWKEVSGVKTYSHYADEGLAAELDASGNVTKTYGYKPGFTWTTDPLFMKIGPDYYFYQNDHLGTPQKLTSTNGAVVWAATYSSFGEATVDAASTITNPLRFPRQYFDEETGLHYNQYRYYNSILGRYLRFDPAKQEINNYAYVHNNPIMFYDPWGLWGVNVGGSAMGMDIYSTIYDSNKGWFPDIKPYINISTTLVGGGFQITFDTPINSNPSQENDLNISLGISKYTGVTYNTELSRGSLNIGLGL